MEPDLLIAALSAEAAATVGLAGTPGTLDRPVPTCPGWDVATLVGHTGRVHRWTAAVLAGERLRSSDIPEPDRADLLDWFAEGAASLGAALFAVDPDVEVWTFSASGDRRARWWARRQALETAVHRVDVAVAAGLAPTPVDTAVAATGVEEYVVDFLPGAVQRAGESAPTGTLHLHATDTDCEWVVDLDARPVSVRAAHEKSATALRGTASDLLLWLWNRPVADGALECHGGAGVPDAWLSLRL